MCESECDTDGDTGGFAAQNADHASVDRWLLRYRGNKQEMEIGNWAAFNRVPDRVVSRLCSTSGRSPRYIEDGLFLWR